MINRAIIQEKTLKAIFKHIRTLSNGKQIEMMFKFNYMAGMRCINFCYLQVKDVLDNHAMDNSRVSLSINGTLYTYSKVLDTKVEVNKSHLSSLGYKSQNDLVNDYKSKGIPVPAEFIQETKQITKFVDTNWTSSSPFGISTTTTVISVGKDVFKLDK